MLWSAPAEPILLRFFETGSYHLGDDALRYRRGSGGRQPLTEPVLATAIFADHAGRVTVDFDAAGTTISAPAMASAALVSSRVIAAL